MCISMEEDWDLQAVVRGCCSSSSANMKEEMCFSGFSFGAPLSVIEEEEEEEEEKSVWFPDLFESRRPNGELEELYKPFFPELQKVVPNTNSIISSSYGVGVGVGGGGGGGRALQTEQQQPKQQQVYRAHVTAVPSQTTLRSKRRKNQQKKVVFKVPAEELSTDKWAWRKYGQKPIKGSPYPRGYYRCSSSKACLARKQVEKSCTDPTVFVVTYTADHNHPQPTHRNSLAGITRNKSPKPATNSKPLYNSPSSSPTTSLTGTIIEDEILQQQMKQENGDEEDADEIVISDMLMTSEDLFMDLLEEHVDITSANSLAVAPTFDDCFVDDFIASDGGS
ncbi:hypothetical protein GIB67_008294 [Kingdonia uniflora]|uniref:WRKY domain-containing protein n=1 Tax=Kingdonia uniflora TaxID=39325 RepID=A0A7J7N4U8_9MAGN|nr:hypothetical protein GIB67_008294 [Kingdonia uniflora]